MSTYAAESYAVLVYAEPEGQAPAAGKTLVTGQSWSLAATQQRSAAIDQQWSLAAALQQELRTDQSWILIAAEQRQSALGQQWTLNVVSTLDSLLRQRWMLTGQMQPSVLPLGTRYECTLTGAPDGTTDVLLPMSSFQARIVSGAQSFLSVVLPDTTQFAQAIADRLNGELVVEQVPAFSDGSETRIELIRVNLEEVRTDDGATNRSTMLTGHKQTTNASPKSIAVTGASFKNLSGRLLYRAKLDPAVNPLDTVIINGDSFIVNRIRYQVDRTNELMELAES